MASLLQRRESSEPRPITPAPVRWYAVQTKARHEKMVGHRLQERAVDTFLPLTMEVHRWSDRKKIVEVPLFGCYLFASIGTGIQDRLRVLRVEGVLGLVGAGGEGTPIPDEQIEAVRRVVEERMCWQSHPFLKVGQRVRIRNGALDGIEGVLISHNGDRTLVISIDAIQRSLAVRVEGYEVEAA